MRVYRLKVVLVVLSNDQDEPHLLQNVTAIVAAAAAAAAGDGHLLSQVRMTQLIPLSALSTQINPFDL